MRALRRSFGAAVLATAVLLIVDPGPAVAQSVDLVVVDVAAVKKGYRASELIGSEVVNQDNEEIGEIDDLIISENRDLYVILQVGGFLGLGGHLVAVDFEDLAVDDAGGKIVLAGGSRKALEDLPEFEYES
jgi:sporulation protein YlmC with PRC-barrel domain